MELRTYSAAAYARMMQKLLPPGRWSLDEDSVLSRVLLAVADELERVGGRVRDLFLESDPREAEELLSRYESDLGLGSDGTKQERRNRIVSKLRRRRGLTPSDIREAIAPILDLDEDDVEIIERDRAFAISVADDREIYRFFVYRNPSLTGSYDVADAQDQLDAVSPAARKGHVIESKDFLTDDEHSLTDRDILGA